MGEHQQLFFDFSDDFGEDYKRNSMDFEKNVRVHQRGVFSAFP